MRYVLSGADGSPQPRRPGETLDELHHNLREVIGWCPAIGFLIPDLARTRVSVIARSEATKQSPVPRNAGLRWARHDKAGPLLPSRNAREGFRWPVM